MVRDFYGGKKEEAMLRAREFRTTIYWRFFELSDESRIYWK
jgi:hypothetical protein